MRQLPQPPNPTFNQKLEIARRLAQYAAYSVMVLLRRDLGFRVLNPLVLFFIFASLAFLSGFGDPANRPQDVFYFAAIMLITGVAKHIIRWFNPAKVHTYYIGNSWLQSLRWPAWMQRNRFIPRFIDPCFVFFTGLALLKLGSPLLGIWLMGSGLSLKWLEHHIHQKELNQRLDTADGLIESEIQGEHVEEFSTPPHQNLSDDPGVPTSIGDDIREQVSKQQHRKTNQP
jgi:hypothetical protein